MSDNAPYSIGSRSSDQMPVATIPHLTMSLGGWCKAFQQPYHSISEWRPAYYVQESTVAAADRRTRAVIIERPSMFAGRLQDGTILPPNGFACTGDGFLIYQGLTGRDYAPTDDMPGYAKGIDAEG